MNNYLNLIFFCLLFILNNIRIYISLFSLFPNTYAYKEKGLLVINYKKSLVVAGAGLEPATFGL